MRDREPEPWLDNAEEDLRSARILTRAAEPELRVAAYHTQQAAEKLLKAMIVAMGNSPLHVHDLDKLLALIPVHDSASPDLQKLRGLAGYFGAFRYPNSGIVLDVPTVGELERWSDEIEQLIASIRARIDPEGKLT